MSKRNLQHILLWGWVPGFAAGLAFAGVVLLIVRPDLSRKDTGLRVGQIAPNFVTTDLNGQRIDLERYKGKVVVLKFWSPTCPHCRDEIETITRVYQAHRENVVFLTVGLGDTTAIREFVTEQHIVYPVLLDEKADLITQYHVNVIPQTYLIGTDGKISHAYIGPQSIEEYDSDLNTMLAQGCNENVCTAIHN